MVTVKQVSELTGVSIRTLQYYDKIGLLPASSYTDAGYRKYDNAALERLEQILLFKELEFPLKDIKKILQSDNFDKSKALKQQIKLLKLKKEHVQNLIDLACAIEHTGGEYMDFTAFDTSKLEEYSEQAKKSWGETAQYKEFEEKNKDRTLPQMKEMSVQLMAIIAQFGTLKNKDTDDPAVIQQVARLQNFITENYYECTDTVLLQLGKMYACGGEFTQNINSAGGLGTAEFACKAIEAYCEKRSG